jgi:hypothetical protein
VTKSHTQVTTLNSNIRPIQISILETQTWIIHWFNVECTQTQTQNKINSKVEV